jgi:allantoinase
MTGPPKPLDLAVNGFTWPGGARLAINFVLNFEEGAELSPAYGDPAREFMSETVYPTGPDQRDLLQESIYAFGATLGVGRLCDSFTRAGLPFTVFACGAAVERSPDVAQMLAEAGCDFVGHGYRWVPHLNLSREQELESIDRTVEAIYSVTSRRIAGWFTRPLPSASTRRLLVSRGFTFDSDSYRDDAPYYEAVDGHDHLIVPYTIDVNDIGYWRFSVSPHDWYQYARDTLDVLYEEGALHPRMMSIGLHARISGRAGRLAGLRRFLTYVAELPDVWVCHRTELAAYWRATVPPPGTSAGV